MPTTTLSRGPMSSRQNVWFLRPIFVHICTYREGTTACCSAVGAGKKRRTCEWPRQSRARWLGLACACVPATCLLSSIVFWSIPSTMCTMYLLIFSSLSFPGYRGQNSAFSTLTCRRSCFIDYAQAKKACRLMDGDMSPEFFYNDQIEERWEGAWNHVRRSLNHGEEGVTARPATCVTPMQLCPLLLLFALGRYPTLFGATSLSSQQPTTGKAKVKV